MAGGILRSHEGKLHRKPHLFLSHNSADKPIVRKLAEELNICGVDVWLDDWELRVGDSLRDEIASAMDRSRYVAVMISEHFHQSAWAKAELNQAFAREMREKRPVILPLLIGSATLPAFVEDKLYLDFRGWRYYPSLVKLTGTLLDLNGYQLDMAIQEKRPHDLKGVYDALRYAGHDPHILVDEQVFRDIVNVGGIVEGELVCFYPYDVIRHPGVSDMTRDVLRRLYRDEYGGLFGPLAS